ncbi:MAG: rod shape-determining protein MreC [Candidatus Nealsonbacteria bacterium]|nr:rod shape-determining protein MreC [Candidatus Nealsonbacteria bacterium]
MKRARNVKIVILLVLMVIVFVVLNLSGFSENIKDFFYSFSLLFQKAFWNLGDNVSGFFGRMANAEALQKELAEINLKNQELLVQLAALQELKKENEFLRESLDIGLEKEFQLELVQIVSKDVSQDSILINKGAEDKISEGLPVITSQKLILGRIGKVYQNFSEVILVSNKKSSFNAEIREKEIYGVVKGKGNFEISFDLVPKDKEIAEGDLVVTSALGGVFPQGFLVGTAKDVKKTDVEQFQTAKIDSGFNLGNLDYLFIIVNF